MKKHIQRTFLLLSIGVFLHVPQLYSQDSFSYPILNGMITQMGKSSIHADSITGLRIKTIKYLCDHLYSDYAYHYNKSNKVVMTTPEKDTIKHNMEYSLLFNRVLNTILHTDTIKDLEAHDYTTSQLILKQLDTNSFHIDKYVDQINYSCWSFNFGIKESDYQQYEINWNRDKFGFTNGSINHTEVITLDGLTPQQFVDNTEYEPGESIKAELKHKDGRMETYTFYKKDSSPSDPYTEVDDKVALLEPSQLNDIADNDSLAATLKKKKKIIIDLRNSSGPYGYNTFYDIMSLFCTKKTYLFSLSSDRYPYYNPSYYTPDADGILSKVDLRIMIDQKTKNYAKIIAYTLQSRNNCKIMGSNTSTKPYFIYNVKKLNDDYYIKYPINEVVNKRSKNICTLPIKSDYSSSITTPDEQNRAVLKD